MLKKILQLFLTFVFLLSFQTAIAAPYISVDMNGRVLSHNQAFDRWYPASLTKMMTAYIAFQTISSGKIKLKTPIRISNKAAHVVPSVSGWRAGSTLTLDTALTVMMVKSANDMANAIGEAIAGSQEAFVAQMNIQASRMGMTGTHFTSAHGLPDKDNYSNARDLAVLALRLRRDFPQYAYYFDIPAIDFGDGKDAVPNTNNLIGRFNGANGMKTGFICASGYNLAASATRRGRTVIAIVLGAERIDSREDKAAKLLNEGFKHPGSPKLTLATLRPYGTHQKETTNLRNDICTLEAAKERRKHIDNDGDPIFKSPSISSLEYTPLAIPVKLLQEAPPIPKKSPKSKDVSVPEQKIILPPASDWRNVAR